MSLEDSHTTKWIETGNGRFGLRSDGIVEVRPHEDATETLAADVVWLAGETATTGMGVGVDVIVGVGVTVAVAVAVGVGKPGLTVGVGDAGITVGVGDAGMTVGVGGAGLAVGESGTGSTVGGGVGKLFFEGIETAEALFDGLRDIAGRHAFGALFHQQPKDIEPCILGERVKRFDRI